MNLVYRLGSVTASGGLRQSIGQSAQSLRRWTVQSLGGSSDSQHSRWTVSTGVLGRSAQSLRRRSVRSLGVVTYCNTYGDILQHVR
eukprot:3905379-Pyramimonas_sp.AAC.1